MTREFPPSRGGRVRALANMICTVIITAYRLILHVNKYVN